MKITCNNCEELMQKYLCDLPSGWRKQIAKVICDFINPSTTLDCNNIKKCETLTTLSAFSINNGEICITYKDENNQSFNRCFNIFDIKIPLDPKCIMSQIAWDTLTWQEQIQAIIDYSCTCQETGCACFTVTNNETVTGVVPYMLTYVDCDNILQSIELIEQESIEICANENIAFMMNFANTIVNNGLCSDTCPSTTTTTTVL